MSEEQFANRASTTLVGAIDGGATSITVASASGFPPAAQFRIVIDTEIMLVTAGAGTTTWTVVRGAEGTTAAAHEDGSSVTHVLTAASLRNVPDYTRRDVLTTKGDLYVADGNASPTRLAAGGDGEVLQADATQAAGLKWSSVPIPYGTPGSSAPGDAPTAGSASTASRSDHVHGREAFGTPGLSGPGDTPADGSAPTVARSDHRHGRESAAVGGDLTGSLPNPLVLQASSAFGLTGIISPPQFSADQNNYDPTGLGAASTLRLSTDASRSLTGLAGGGAGRLIIILNVGANPLVLASESAGSSAPNRFSLGADLTLGPSQGALLSYDGGHPAGGSRPPRSAGARPAARRAAACPGLTPTPPCLQPCWCLRRIPTPRTRCSSE
ncbi:MAG TPA: hypothetical protein VFC51_07975 [Chloroflexota bacterium]|nr:hypothetical protein [Chloroflexota bacterium]